MWHKNPFRLLDPDDYAAHPNASASTLYQYYLREYTVSRPTDASVFIRMIAAAKRNIEPELLMTRRQERTDILIEEATLMGVPAHKLTRYIAEREGVGIRAIQRRFNRMGIQVRDAGNMFASSVIPQNKMYGERTGITDRQIEAWMQRHPVKCVACNRVKAPPGRFLCHACHDYHRNPDYPEWLVSMIAIARRQHRSDAKNALMVAMGYEETA